MSSPHWLRNEGQSLAISEQILLQILVQMALPDPATVLPLEGDIDLHVSPRLENALKSIIRKRPDRVIVDMSSVTFIDSSGLAVLIRAMQDVQDYGGKLILLGIGPGVRSILEIARLDQFFLIDQRDDELLAAD